MQMYQRVLQGISPGPSDTPFLAAVNAENPKLMESVKKAIPLRRLGQPEDIANAVVFWPLTARNILPGRP